jgi:hypothetical protein
MSNSSATTTMEAAKKEFLARAIPFMLAKFYKAETYGIDWRHCKLEELDFFIHLAQEATDPSPCEVME